MLFNRAAVYENQTVLTSSCEQINPSVVLCYIFLVMRIMQVSSGAGQHSKLQRLPQDPVVGLVLLITSCDVYLSQNVLFDSFYKTNGTRLTYGTKY